MTETLAGSIMVDHGVHGPGINGEIKPGSSEFPEVAKVVPPVGLRHHCNAVAPFLEPPCNHGRPKGGVVYECVSGKKDNVNVIPSKGFHFLYGRGKHI